MPVEGLSAEELSRPTELDASRLPAFQEQIQRFEAVWEQLELGPLQIPAAPRWALPAPKTRRLVSLDRALQTRRCTRELRLEQPSAKVLGQLLGRGHGLGDSQHSGPAPSAGNLQGVELYLVFWQSGWCPAGVYHYDRPGHHLSQISAGADREQWKAMVPTLHQIQGGSFLVFLVGNGVRVMNKYGDRGVRFLLLEAGHILQNLALLSTGLGLSLVPCGGVLEGEVARYLRLPRQHLVLYGAVGGQPQPARRAGHHGT